MIVGIEVEAGDIADDRQLIDVDLPGADKEIGREGVDEVANRRIRESEVAEAELLPFDTGAVDAMSRDRLAVEQQRQAPVIDRLPVDRRRRCARVDDAVESTGGRGRQHNGRSEEPTSELQSLMRISYAGF